MPFSYTSLPLYTYRNAPSFYLSLFNAIQKDWNTLCGRHIIARTSRFVIIIIDAFYSVYPQNVLSKNSNKIVLQTTKSERWDDETCRDAYFSFSKIKKWKKKNFFRAREIAIHIIYQMKTFFYTSLREPVRIDNRIRRGEIIKKRKQI